MVFCPHCNHVWTLCVLPHSNTDLIMVGLKILCINDLLLKVEVVFSIQAQMNLFRLITEMSHWTKGNCRQMEMRVTDMWL